MQPHAIALGLLLSLSHPTHGRETPQTKQAPVDCRQIIQKAVKACLAVQQVEYVEEHRIRDEKTPSLVSKVRQARAKVPQAGFMPGKFVVEGSESPNGQPAIKLASAYDGATLRILSPKDKTVRVVRSPSLNVAAGLLAESGTALIGMPQLSQDQPFQNLLADGVTFEYQGTRTIQGTVCHAIAATTSVEHPSLGKQSMTSLWFIGRDDNLPRGTSIGPIEKTIRIVAVNPPSAGDYVVATPAGFSEKLVTGNEARVDKLLPVGSSAPDWKLADPTGRVHSLKDYRGKVVVLDFWGTWCVPCQKSMPSIQAVHEKFKGRGVNVFGVAVADAEGQPAAYMKRKGYTYTLLMKGDEVAAAYKAVMLPTLYVIGPDGKVVHAEFGLRQNLQTELSSVLENALKSR